ncbi:MAG: hypothetical protein H6862_00635 [Rhodospirillales bacterium]|nr:hypothetical protein [Rhodospirillales bacterium]
MSHPMILSPRSFRISGLVALFTAFSVLTGCSDRDTSMDVSAQTPAPPPMSAAKPSMTPESIAPGPAPGLQGMKNPAPLSPGERGGEHLSIDRYADAAFKAETGPATKPPAALGGASSGDMTGALESSQSTDERLDSLEESVASLRSEFDTLLPAIRELIEAGKAARISVASGTPTPSDPVAAPKATTQAATLSSPAASKTPPVAVQTPVPAASTEVSNVTGVRIGIHPDRTRIVLDLSGPAKFQTDLDNMEKILLVDLPETLWKASGTQTAPGKSLLSSWSTQSAHEGKGSTAVFQLNGPVKILSTSALRPEGKSGHRIVIDIGPEGT